MDHQTQILIPLFRKKDAIKALQSAIDIYTDRGRFHPAATHQKAMAEIYETDLTDLENAMTSYQKAADFYSSEDSKALVDLRTLETRTII